MACSTSNFDPLSGPIRAIPPDLPLDGKIHTLANCVDSDDPKLPKDSCDAVATHTDDGRWLVLVRANGSLFGVTRIIWHALLWALSLTIIPGAAGWHLLRRRPLRRIRGDPGQRRSHRRRRPHPPPAAVESA